MSNKKLSWFKKFCGITSFLFLHGCLHNPNHFKWEFGIKNFSTYPTLFTEIDLTLEDGFILTLDKEEKYVGHYDWHNGNRPFFENDIYGYKALPKKAKLTWYSFKEKKYFSGTVDLPYEKMLSMFKAGTVNYENGRNSTFASIQLGTRKDGNIDIFLWDRYHSKYVASVKVPEAGSSISKIPEEEIDAYIKRYGFSLEKDEKHKYEEISKTFHFNFQFKSTADLKSGELEYSNGEDSFFNVKYKSELAQKEKDRRIFSIPTQIRLFFRSPGKKTDLITKIKLNFEEIYHHIKDLDHNTEIKFTVEVDGQPYISDSNQYVVRLREDLCKVFIEFKGKQIPIKLFKEDSYWNVHPNSGHH